MVLDHCTAVSSGGGHVDVQVVRCSKRTRHGGGDAGIGRVDYDEREGSLANDIFL